MKFVKLTNPDHSNVYVNPHNVTSVYQHRALDYKAQTTVDGTRIVTVQGGVIDVLENQQFVVAELEQHY